MIERNRMSYKKPNQRFAPAVIAGVTIGLLVAGYKLVFANKKSKLEPQVQQDREELTQKAEQQQEHEQETEQEKAAQEKEQQQVAQEQKQQEEKDKKAEEKQAAEADQQPK